MGDSSNKYEDSDWLRGQYVDQRRSAPDIAKQLGCSASTIGRWLKIHGVEMRTGAETKITEQTRKLRNEEWLREQYIGKRKSLSDIGEELGMAAATVGEWLSRHEIPARSNSVSQTSEFAAEKLDDPHWLKKEYVEKKRSTTGIAEELDLFGFTVSSWLHKHDIETREGGRTIPEAAKERLRDREWLHREYAENRCTTSEIASQLGCSEGTVSRWLRKHDIEGRSTRENKLSERAARLLDDTEWLRDEYINKRRTLAQIADDLGVTPRAVGLRLDHHWFDRRAAGESVLSPQALEYLRDDEWLQQQYVQNERKSVDIAQEVGCSDSTVRDWLRKYDVELRDISDIRAEGDIEKLRDEDWLRTQYLKKEKSGLEIAELTGMSHGAVTDYLENTVLKYAQISSISLDLVTKSDLRGN